METKIPKKIIGYKVMATENGKLISGADKRQLFDLKLNEEIKMTGNGIYLGMNKDYVMDYYSGLAEEEVLLTFEFNEDCITSGDITDKEPEISVRIAKIIEINKIEEGEIVENKKNIINKKVKQKMNKISL